MRLNRNMTSVLQIRKRAQDHPNGEIVGSQPASKVEPPKKRWVEPVTALLMALATLSTAWCSYQSAAWTRKSGRMMHEFSSLEHKAGLLNIQGAQAATIHAAMFMQLLAAQQAGNEKLAAFYVQ